MNGIKETCDCGHDRATHFEKESTCLGVHCDCKRYREPGSPPTPRAPRDPKYVFGRGPRPHLDPKCCCTKCLEWSWL